eukprot:Rmarinus@m.10521
MSNYKHVAICVDGSDYSQSAFKRACDMVKSTEGAELHVLHAVETIPFYTAYMTSGGGMNDPVNREMIAKGRALLLEYENKLKDSDIKHHLTLVEGTHTPKESTVTYLERKPEIDCLVLGTRGLGAVKRLMMGSFADYMVHHCPCDVLVIKKREEKKK